jgi:hypothetical protein
MKKHTPTPWKLNREGNLIMEIKSRRKFNNGLGK